MALNVTGEDVRDEPEVNRYALLTKRYAACVNHHCGGVVEPANSEEPQKVSSQHGDYLNTDTRIRQDGFHCPPSHPEASFASRTEIFWRHHKALGFLMT